MALFSPYSGPKEIKYLFIDGGCLRASLRRMGETYAAGAMLHVDYEQLTRGFSKVFYYDALPGRRVGENQSDYEARIEPERQFFDELSSLDRIHVYEGDARRSAARRSQEQKKIDVMIAVDMLTHSFRRNMHEATLLTSDLDFKPLIDALVQEGMLVTLWYPPADTTKELISAADRRQPLTIQSVYPSLVDESRRLFELPKGTSEPDKGDYAPVLARWTAPKSGEHRLMKQAEDFILVQPNPNPGYVTYLIHPDLKLLRTYAREVYQVVIPPVES